MFNLKHPMSIRLQRWMTVVLALGVFSFAPLASETLLSQANAVIANPTPDCTAVTTCTITFTYSTTDYYQWSVPAGITSVTVDVRGAQGGGAGGYGGKVTATLAVSSFSNLYVYVGATTGYNGGGAKAVGLANTGTTGGGASDIRASASGASYTDRLIVAGGGGGRGANCTGSATSGAGGGLTGANGCSTRGTAIGGSQVAGGAGGNNATAGSFGVGGNGGYCGGSGGGGGGYYGGGGGGSDYPSYCDNDDANGAGGSSYTNASYVTGVTHTQGAVTGDGSVAITYPNGPSISSSGGLTVAGTTGITLYDTITAAGGSGARTLSMNSANPGVSFNASTGLVTITGASVGSFTQTFTVTDSSSPAKTNSITVTFVINAAPSASLTNSTITTTVGRTASETMTVSNGTGAKTFALSSSLTQSGITLDTTSAASGYAVLKVAATGVAPGTYIETITATDTVGSFVRSVITVTINAAPTLAWETTTALTTTAGRARLETVTASNGSGAKTFTLTQGAVTSAGITLDTTTAASGYARLNISASVTAGTYYETITATDTKGASVTIAKTVIVNPAITFALGASSTFGTPAGTAGYDTLTVTGGTLPRSVTVVGSPTNSGITVSAPSATQAVLNVASTVSAATYLETVTVTDAVGASASHLVTLTVSGPIRFDAANASTINTSVGRSASAVISTVSGNTGKVFTMVAGSSPVSAAITLDTSTANSGYVTLNVSSSALAGSYIESITVVDSSNSRATWLVTVNVNPAPVLTYESATAGSNFTSLVFNGSNQYATVPSNANLVMGSDYTIEWWQYQTDSNSYPRIFSFGGSGLEVSIEGGTFYFWTAGGGKTLATGLNVKNKWVHFAIVSRNNNVTLYLNGVAQRAAVLANAVTASNLPSTGLLCIASECSVDSRLVFGGRLANFTISNTPRYSGSDLVTASFTPSYFSTVDANTLLALGAVNSEAKFTDSSSFARVVSYVGTPTGNSSHPSGATANISITTTQGITKRSSVFTASAGTGTKTFTMTPSVNGVTLDTSLANNAYIVISETVTATNSTTARIINETVTATDTLGAATSFNVAITVNPPIALTATTSSLTSTFGLMGYDTITATAGTGTGAITYSLVSNPTSSGITLVSGAAGITVLTVSRSVATGTYYETVTATDSLGATTSIPITLTVNPGISLAGAGGISTITTSFGGTASLQVNASNGGSGKTFTMQAASVATNAGITLDTTNAASGYAVVRVASTVPANTYLETVTVTDSQGGVAKLLVTVVVNAAPTISGPTTIATTAGTAISTTAFTAASGTGTKTLTLSGLNSGITIDTSTANSAIVNLTSSLTTTDSVTVRTIFETVTATDQSGAVIRASLRITVNPAVVETATATSITTTSGVSRTVTIYATQGTGTKTFTRTSAVASSAITMSTAVTNQAVLTIGALTSPGTYYETITATDTLNSTRAILITITVNGPPTASGPTNLYTTQGVTFNSPLFQAFGGNGTYSFSLQSNPSAAGISVSSPSAGYARITVLNTVSAGTYNETLTVTDGLSATGIFTFTIRVNAPVALSGTQTISTTYGEAFTTGFNSSGGTGPFTFSAANICAISRSTFIGDGSNGTVNGTSYTVDQILGTGTCNWISPIGVDSASVLVIAGGGAGGTRAGGGGGAGGYQYVASQAITPNTSYSVLVGAGGTGVLVNSATNGEDSRFGSLALVKGGGGGGGAITAGTVARSGKDGGSGGGAAGYLTNQSATNGKGTAGQGNDGGNAMPDNAWPGGGGGGASGAGTTAISNVSPAGKGGAGISNSITGASLCYATGGGAGTKVDYTAGQAGDCGGATSPNGGIGTAGSLTPSNPKPNTGAGGGGSGWSASGDLVGGNGASGVVVLRYVTPTAEADNSKISYLVSSAGTSSSAGLLTLSVPQTVSAGSYSHTVKVTDSTGSVSTPVTVNITVNKANPVITLSLPGAANSTQYGFGVQLSAQVSTAGNVQFKDNGTEITGCGAKATSSFVATCRWVPNTVATRTITAVFTPTDTSNYNTGITATMTVVVTKADTLTVTSRSENFTFTNSAAAVTKRFTITGLAEIDSATTLTTTYIGTANDSSSYNSTTAPTKAGDNYEIRPSALVFATGSASNYQSINYVSGVLAISRATNNGTFNYPNSNSLTYRLSGVESLTVTTFGEAVPVYSGSTPEKCSINSSSGSLSILEAGTCSVTMDVPQGYNYLSTSVTKNVTINKAPRTILLSTASSSIKYGDTATVTTTISAGQGDGNFIYGTDTPLVCQYDVTSSQLLATRGSGTCNLVAAFLEGTNYLAATSNTLSLTAALADAPVVTTAPIDPVSYNGGNAISVTPRIRVTGLKRSDTANSATFTYAFQSSPAGSFSYSSTSVPTEGGIYSVTPSALTLSVGSLSNYQTPSYAASDLEIEQIDQPELVILNLTGEVTFPIKLVTTGGATAITNVVYVVTASTATNCRAVYGPIIAGGESIWTLQADSAGSCSVRAGKLQTRNYRTVISETATVTVLLFVKAESLQSAVSNFSTGVTISSGTILTKGSSSCSSNCVPSITSISAYTGYVGDMLVLTGTNFTGATKVIFNVFTNASNFSNDPVTPDTQITVQVPVGLTPGEVGIEVVALGGISPRNFDFELLP